MEKNQTEKRITRRNFFTGAGMFLTGAAVSAAGCSMLKPAPEAAANKVVWPYPFKKIDPELVRKRAHLGYYKGK